MTNPKAKQFPLSDTELAQLALNEHGFLFQQRAIAEIKAGDIGGFRVLATEYPVSVHTGLETKIDAVVAGESGGRANWHLVLECKRANPLYKRWLFFDELAQASVYSIESAHLAGTWNQQGDPPMVHAIGRISVSKDCRQFNYYLEAMQERPGANKRASATDAIEDAFQQVTLGCAGLSRRLRETHRLQFQIVPVVVTTAEIQVASFSTDRISLSGGRIEEEHLTLSAANWLAVDYRMNDSLTRCVKLTTNPQSNIAQDLLSRHQRTVFVVQSTSLTGFIRWFATHVGNCHA